jgi:hypothetical protein
LREKTC